MMDKNYNCLEYLASNTVLRSNELIMLEIDEAIALHGYKHICFKDDIFNIDSNSTLSLCALLKQKGVPWCAAAHLATPATTQHEIFDAMIEAGCIGLKLWVGSLFADGQSCSGHFALADAVRTISYLSQYPELTLRLCMASDIEDEKSPPILESLGFGGNANPRRQIYRQPLWQ